jgi:hydrogenase maturation protein HypF
MRLEALCEDAVPPVALPLARDAMGIWRTDWAPLVAAMRDARRSAAVRAAMFHSSLAQALYAQAIAIREHTGVARVGLGGGVFQNRVLTEHAHALLTSGGFEVLIPERLPVNDAAISYGQLIEAIAVQTANAGHEPDAARA